MAIHYVYIQLNKTLTIKHYKMFLQNIVAYSYYFILNWNHSEVII